MYNKIILAGNLTRDIEIRYTSSNLAISHTGIAVNRKFKSQTGEQKEEVLFVDLSFFGRTAEIANQYLRRGSKVLVEGRLKLDQWTDKSGMKRSKHSVIVENLQMLDSRQEREMLEGGTPPMRETRNSGAESTMPAQKAAPEQPTVQETTISEGDIPF